MKIADAGDRVLRLFVPRIGRDYYIPIGESVVRSDTQLAGAYVDVEATGLNTQTAEIIELGIVPFIFEASGLITGVAEGWSMYRDPGMPIPEEVVELTGITDDMVRGLSLDEDYAKSVLSSADLIIAHNAGYDRPVMERLFPWLAPKRWGCSFREIDWRKDYGAPCSKLGHLLIEVCDEYSKGHRAVDDCHVAVHLLARRAADNRTALARLLDRVRTPTQRLWAGASRFDLNDAFKERKYRWHDGEAGHAKSWYHDANDRESAVAEWRWLQEQGIKPELQNFTARDRYSVRMDP